MSEIMKTIRLIRLYRRHAGQGQCNRFLSFADGTNTGHRLSSGKR
jgi:hypothetical protein